MISALFDSTVNFFVSLIESTGYLGIFLLMTIESTILPLPSELVLPFAGILVAQGKMSFVLALVASTLGSVTGALINYSLAFYLGRKLVNKLLFKYGKIFFVTEEHLLRVEKYFNEHGAITTFLGRITTGFRHLISLPAGFTRMNLGTFCIFTALGAAIWSAILIYLGVLFGNNLEAIKSNLKIISVWLILVIAIIVIIYLIWRRFRKI